MRGGTPAVTPISPAKTAPPCACYFRRYGAFKKNKMAARLSDADFGGSYLRTRAPYPGVRGVWGLVLVSSVRFRGPSGSSLERSVFVFPGVGGVHPGLLFPAKKTAPPCGLRFRSYGRLKKNKMAAQLSKIDFGGRYLRIGGSHRGVRGIPSSGLISSLRRCDQLNGGVPPRQLRFVGPVGGGLGRDIFKKRPTISPDNFFLFFINQSDRKSVV